MDFSMIFLFPILYLASEQSERAFGMGLPRARQISLLVTNDLQYGRTNLGETFKVNQVNGRELPRKSIVWKKSKIKTFV